MANSPDWGIRQISFRIEKTNKRIPSEFSPAGFRFRNMDEAQIAQFIIATVSSSGQMLGSRLGSEVNRKFPELKRNPSYQMKRFIDQQCGGEVVKIADHGGDDLYGIRDGSSLGGASQVNFTPASSWRLFQHTDEIGTLAVNSESGDIAALPADAPAPEEPWRTIPRMTDEDHREIARSFLAVTDEDVRSVLEAALQPQDYWQGWSRLVNYGFDGRYRQQWATFRFEQICNKFRESLLACGLDSAIVERAFGLLIAEKKRTQAPHRTEPGFQLASPSGRSDQLAKLDANSELRRIVQAVVENLSETDLRRLWLPMGEVIDALRKTSR